MNKQAEEEINTEKQTLASETTQDNKLIKELDVIKKRLYEIANPKRKYHEEIASLKQNHYKEKHAESLLKETDPPIPKTPHSMFWIVLVIILIISILALGSYLFIDYTLTGNAITGFSIS